MSDSIADRQLTGSKWVEAWADRTYAPHQYFALCLICALSTFSCVSALRFLLFVIRLRKQSVKPDQDSLKARFEQYEKRSVTASRTQLAIAIIYYLAGTAIWFGDAVIGISLIATDAQENPDVYTWGVWAELAIYCIQSMAAFMSVFYIFPMLQVLFVSWTYAKLSRRTNKDGTLAPWIPEFRTLTTHLCQLWALVSFFIIAFWPIGDQSFTRMMILQAACGSGVAWGAGSIGLNFDRVEIHAEETGSRMTTRDAMRLCGQTWLASKICPVAQPAPIKYDDEKEALLGESKA